MSTADDPMGWMTAALQNVEPEPEPEPRQARTRRGRAPGSTSPRPGAGERVMAAAPQAAAAPEAAPFAASSPVDAPAPADAAALDALFVDAPASAGTTPETELTARPELQDGLDGLFDDAPAAQAAAPNTDDAVASDLQDLFGEDTPTGQGEVLSAPPAGVTLRADGGQDLTGLFDDPAPAPPSPAVIGEPPPAAPDPGPPVEVGSTPASDQPDDATAPEADPDAAAQQDPGHFAAQVWFPDGGMSAHLPTLAQSVQPEAWTESGHDGLPVLASYLRHTWRRLAEQGKLATAELGRGTVAAFHTGLYTDHFEAVYALLESNPHPGRQPWVFRRWVTESAPGMQPFVAAPPAPATYADGPADVVYDIDQPLHAALDHIVDDNVDRFPQALRDNRHQRRLLLEAAIKDAQKCVAMNWRVAMPYFYREGGTGRGRVQLLLPLCLLSPGVPDLALAVDRGPGGYRAHTVLTLPMARRNARLMTRPAPDWLHD